MRVPFQFANDRLVVSLDKPVIIKKDDPRFNAVAQALREGKSKEEIKDLLEPEKHYVEAVQQSGTNLEVRDGEVYLNGKVLHSVMADRVKDLMRHGLPFEPMLRFMENLSLNPSYTSQQELPLFLEHRDLPITEDGYLLAYKSVRQTMMDWYSNSVDNSVGQKPKMDRGEVSDRRDHDCSNGFHVGCISYINSFHNGENVVVIVKIHPKDVVSVPYNECTKMRVCEYEVIGIMDKVFDNPVYNSELEPVATVQENIVGFDYNAPNPNWNEVEKSYNDEYDDEYDYDEDEDDTDDDWEDEDNEPSDYVGNLDEEDDDYPMPQDVL